MLKNQMLMVKYHMFVKKQIFPLQPNYKSYEQLTWLIFAFNLH